MKAIESVIFDWGGVLIDDPAPGRLRYCAEVLEVPERDLAEAFADFTADFQTAAMSEEVFWEKVCANLNVAPPKHPSLWAEGFRAAYREREDMFAVAAHLQQRGCKTAVLSNTEIPAMRHFERMNYEIFDVRVFSCAEGTRKPERRIYEIAWEKLATTPEEAVFIDDDPKYTDAAKRAGLNVILFESIDQLRGQLALLGTPIE